MSKLDPVLRCDSCNLIVKLETLHKIGTCPKCGNKRVKNTLVLSEEEKKQVEDWGYHEFLKEFEVADE